MNEVAQHNLALRNDSTKLLTEVRRIVLFQCPICNSTYYDYYEAQKCLNQPFEPIFKVGDIVTRLHEDSGWFNGEKHWIAVRDTKHPMAPWTPEKAFLTFYHVITAITGDIYGPILSPHVVTYHLRTKAMVDNGGLGGYAGGYTNFDKHVKLKLVENPPARIVEESKELLGLTSTVLL